MNHHERWSGEVTIILCYVGRSHDNRARYSGAAWLDVDGRRERVEFKDLQSGVGGVSSGLGFGYEDEEEQAFDAMAENALSFLSYYTSDNRPDDPREVPSWAPEPEVCDAFGWEAEHSENDGFAIRRERGGPIVYTDGRHTEEFRIPYRPVAL